MITAARAKILAAQGKGKASYSFDDQLNLVTSAIETAVSNGFFTTTVILQYGNYIAYSENIKHYLESLGYTVSYSPYDGGISLCVSWLE
jgi:hypothetical protein